MRIIFVLTISMLLAYSCLNAQVADSTKRNEKGSIKVELNPAFYILGGYSVRGYYVLPKKWSVGLQVEAGFELPDDFADAFFDSSAPIDVDWDYAVSIETRYRFTEASYDKGFFALANIGIEGWTVSEDVDTGASDDFDNWFAALGVGYNWYPFKKKNFNVGATYNVIFLLNNTNTRQAGDTNYSLDSIVPPSLAPSNIYISWRF
ncbi:MAG: hypothetical protein AAF363_22320 [Bacteroidota bacterium]